MLGYVHPKKSSSSSGFDDRKSWIKKYFGGMGALFMQRLFQRIDNKLHCDVNIKVSLKYDMNRVML